jgi:hypothetical protein
MTPNNIHRPLTQKLFSFLSPAVKLHFIDLQEIGFSFYVVDQVRGRCYGSEGVITIPKWAILTEKTKPGYIDWYVSHEMAHAFCYVNGICDIHGPNFMKMLMSICPVSSVHYELEYKTKNAIMCGIQIPADLL